MLFRSFSSSTTVRAREAETSFCTQEGEGLKSGSKAGGGSGDVSGEGGREEERTGAVEVDSGFEVGDVLL